MHEHQLKTIEAYNKSADLYANKIAKLTNYDHCYDYLVSLIKPQSTILDLACGPGNIGKYISNAINVKCIGYDLSPNMIELAKKQ